MAIPDKSEFQALVDLAGEKLCAQIPAPKPDSLNPIGDSEEYFGLCWDAIELRRTAVRKLAAWRWLDSQVSFLRARKAAATKGSVDPMIAGDKSEFVKRHTAKVVEMLSDYSHLGQKIKRNARWPDECSTPPERFKRYLSMAATTVRPLRLYADIAVALSSYHFSSQHHGKAHSDEIGSAAEVIDSIVSRLNIEVWPICTAMPYNSTSTAKLTSIVNKLESLSLDLSREQRRAYPTTRNDETAGERRLVWDLRTAFRKEFDADKTAAIFHLTLLEGVRRPPDKRAIERLLSGWKTARETSAPAEVDG